MGEEAMWDGDGACRKHSLKCLSQNQLKLIAAGAMVSDHIGYMLLPQLTILRIVGRLAFPLFAFFVCEGSRYTHSRTKYLLRMLGMGLLCVVGYYIFDGSVYGNVLITFSLSIPILYSIQLFKKELRQNASPGRCAAAALAVLACVFCVRVFCSLFPVDYGFLGVMLPVFVEVSGAFALSGFFIGLLLLSVQMGGNQYFCLLSVPLLLLYNGTRGKYRMKYFFYWFYPLHLALIGAASLAVEAFGR